MGPRTETTPLADRVAAVLQGGPYVLAVSGGVDSMVLLHSASRCSKHLVVATFNHGTGPAATNAASLVAETAAELGIPCTVGEASQLPRTEAAWRAARWGFLRTVARQTGGTIVTAHTRDDQIETVFMRAMREAGPRGLAGLYAESDVVRPLLGVSRAEVDSYAASYAIHYHADPSNTDRRHLRNRVRHDLLPAIEAVRPGFSNELLDLAARSAEWRARMDHISASFSMMLDGDGHYHFPRAQFSGMSDDVLRTLWPSLAARAGVVMDWRGTHRLASFTIEGETGQSIQLSGGIEVRMQRNDMVLRRWRADGRS